MRIKIETFNLIKNTEHEAYDTQGWIDFVANKFIGRFPLKFLHAISVSDEDMEVAGYFAWLFRADELGFPSQDQIKIIEEIIDEVTQQTDSTTGWNLGTDCFIITMGATL